MRPLLALLAALLSLPAAARGIENATSLVWLGLDYTHARFISTVDFRDEEKVVGTYPAAWNELVIKEILPDLRRPLGVPITADTDFMYERNRSCSTDQIVRKDGGADRTHLSRHAVAEIVAGWTPETRTGYGFGIVVDRLVKLDDLGCGWIAFVHLSDMSLVDARRYCEKAGGFGFRNYWFTPFKTILRRDLKRYWRYL